MTQLSDIQRATLETLAYSDIFEYPLRLAELHRYLNVRASVDEVRAALETLTQIDCREGLYFLRGHDDYVAIRLGRESASRPHFERAVRYGRVLSGLPFVRMVALTGSLAVLNLSKGADMDYMLVTAPRHVWTARAFAVTLGRILRLFGSTLCVNLIVSENALAWPLHDLYSAREMCQMIPIAGFDMYQRLRQANPWTEKIFPNTNMESNRLLLDKQDYNPAFQKLFELPWRTKLGARFEAWAMKYQLHRIGYHGDDAEVNFNADVCQGNFHHHRQWATKHFQQRLVEVGLADKPWKGPRVYP